MIRSQPGPRLVERFVATCLITMALAVIAVLAFQRFDIETRPRSIEIAFPENRLIQAMRTDPEALQKLQAAGVTTLMRVPYTLDDMIRYGLAEAWHPEKDLMEIRLADNQLTSNATIYLTGQFGMEALQIRIRENVFICDIRLPAPIEKIEPNRFILEIPSGPIPEGFRSALLLPVGDWGKTHDLNQFTRAIYSLQPDSVVPFWNGGMHANNFFSSYMKTPWLRKPVMAVPEFHLPRLGRAALQKYSRRQILRAHCVLRRTAARYTPQRLQQRLLRAVVERGVNFIYVEPPQGWSFAQSVHFFNSLKIDLAGRGFQTGAATPAHKGRTGHLAMGILYGGLGALAFLFIWQIALWAVGFSGQDEQVDRVLTIRLRPMYFRWSAVVFVTALLIIHFEGSAAWGGKISAWLVACLVPLISIMLVPSYTSPAETARQDVFSKPVKSFLLIVLINILAGLGIGVLLFQTNFIHRLDMFFGVKAAYVVPLMVAAIYLFPGITDGHWWKARWQGENRYWTLGAMVLLGAGIFIMLVRSGNVTWFPVSVFEMNLRESMETLFGIRPRWKEFFIGHPFLLLGLMGLKMSAKQERVWPRVCLVIGLIGQISIINTFCHIHTPLHISLLRTLLGVGLGLFNGMLLMMAVRSMERWRSRR